MLRQVSSGLVLCCAVLWRASLPSGNAHLLQFAPSFACDELAGGMAKGRAARALEVGQVAVRICDPSKDLVGQDILAQRGDFILRLRNHTFRQ